MVDAVAGVQVQTEKVWKMANDYGVARIVVINRMDRERADFFRALESLQRRLKGRLCPLQIPIGSEAAFQGVVDLVKMKALLVADGKPREAEIPPDAMDAAKEWREKLTEAAAETDDDLLAKYLEEGAISEAEMLGALRKAIAGGTLVPVLAAAAPRLIGVHALMDLLVEEFPSPADLGAVEGTDLKSKAAATRAPDPKAPFAALVFKTISDPHVGKLSVFRVLLRHPQGGQPGAQRHPRRQGARRPHRLAAGQDAEGDRGPGPGRDRRGRQAQGHPDRRHPDGRGPSLRAPRHPLPGARHLLRDPAQVAG